MDSVQYRAVVLNVFIMLTGKIAQREKKMWTIGVFAVIFCE